MKFVDVLNNKAIKYLSDTITLEQLPEPNSVLGGADKEKKEKPPTEYRLCDID